MELRPFKLSDMDQLDLQDMDNWALIDDLRQWEGQAFTILDDDNRPIGISGFACAGGIGTGWLVGSKQLREHPVFLHRTMKRMLRTLLQNPTVDCIYSDVEKSSKDAVRWLERLGFRYESENETTERHVLNKDTKW